MCLFELSSTKIQCLPQAFESSYESTDAYIMKKFIN